MKGIVRVVSVAMILAMVLGALGSGSVLAAARDTSWQVSVTYQNVGTGDATIMVDFYPELNGTAISFNPLAGTPTGKLAAGAGASFWIGSVTGLPGTFRGSAVMSSDQPLVATVVQFHPNATGETFKMRMLSNGFQASDGSNQTLVATTLAQTLSRTTVFSIQNTESENVLATVHLIDAATGTEAAGAKTWDIPAGSSKYVEMDKTSDTGLAGTVFNGSAIITAVLKSNPATPAKVVAAASEMYTNKNVAANFEGMPLSKAANTLYMATALCANSHLETYYAVQNSSTTAGDTASISVKYYDKNGAEFANNGPFPVGPGQKKSLRTCDATVKTAGTTMTNFTGSAVITSVGAKIVAIGKAQGAQGDTNPATVDVFTAFLGEPAGYAKLALPFVRWASDANYTAPTNMGGKQRTFLAVMSLDPGANIKFHVKYFGANGGAALADEVLTLNSFAKGNSSAFSAGALNKAGSGMNPDEFGYYTDGKFGGGIVVEPDAANPNAKFIAIARVQNPGAGEDYNGVPVP